MQHVAAAGQVKSENDSAPAVVRQSLAALLQFAWDAEVFTSNDAMPLVGLTRSTTIEALNELAGYGLVSELPNARQVGEYRKGRPARRFELHAGAGAVVGVDAGRAHLSVVVADLRGTALGQHEVELAESEHEAHDRREAATVAVDVALARAGLAREDVVAVCVGVPAPVAGDGISPPHREGFWEKMNPGFVADFKVWAPLVRVENDATLAAVAERRVGAAVGCDDFVALLAGRRFGAGVVSGGTLLRGANGGVGEMAPLLHLMGVEGSEGLGDRLVTGVRDALAKGRIPASHALALQAPSAIAGRDVLALAADPFVAPVVAQVAAALARIVGLTGSMYDPDRVILCGAVADGVEPVLAHARELLPAEMALPAPKLVASRLGGKVVAAGAVAAAVEAAREVMLELVLSGRFAVRPVAAA